MDTRRVQVILSGEQFVARAHEANYPKTSCKTFCLYLLTDAINIIVEYQDEPRLHKRQIFNETMRWVRKGNVGQFTFDQICQELDLASDAVRQRLLAGTVKKVTKAVRRNYRKISEHRSRALN